MNKAVYTICLHVFFLIQFVYSNNHPGKMIITGFRGTVPTQPEIIALKEKIDAHHIGGIILFNRNIVNREQLIDLIAYLKKDTPIFIAIDHEGGLVNRLTHPSFHIQAPSPHDVCTMAPNDQYRIAHENATELAALGITLNLGGVVDLKPLIEPSSICNAKRCYSDTSDIVVQCIQPVIAAHKAAGVIIALKHFPGHGSTATDSHITLPTIQSTYTPYEWMPYYAILSHPSPYIAVMTGHIMLPTIDPLYPASLSQNHIQTIRHSFHFNGLIITDDLHMGALKSMVATPSDAAYQAALAGNDLLLFEYLSLDDIDRVATNLQTAIQKSPTLNAHIQSRLSTLQWYVTK